MRCLAMPHLLAVRECQNLLCQSGHGNFVPRNPRVAAQTCAHDKRNFVTAAKRAWLDVMPLPAILHSLHRLAAAPSTASAMELVAHIDKAVDITLEFLGLTALLRLVLEARLKLRLEKRRVSSAHLHQARVPARAFLVAR